MSLPRASNSPRSKPFDEGYNTQNLGEDSANVAPSNQVLLDAIQALTGQLQTMSRHQDEMLDEIRRLTNTVHTLENKIAPDAPSDPVPDTSLPSSVVPAATSPSPDGSVIVCPPPLSPPAPPPSPPSLPPPPSALPGISGRRPRPLAREDSFYFSNRANPFPRPLAREGAFYHISNSETFPFKAPNGGVVKRPNPTKTSPPSKNPESPTSATASSSSPKRKHADADKDVKDPGGSSSGERSKKRRRNSDEGDVDEGQSASRSPKRQLPTRRRTSSRK